MINTSFPNKLWLAVLGLMFPLSYAHAQVFGGNPPAIKWQQINTPEAKVIFPYGMDTTGQRVANIIHQMSGLVKPTIGTKQKQVSIVLQDQYTISNAYVQLAPFRSEFYLTPDQNSFELGTLNWADQLAIHEYRHVQQYNNFNVGLSKALRTIFGEGGQALGNELSVPNWFFEGDAVYNETLVSAQGRGRLPYFFNGYRGLWAAGKNYSYQKLRNGSYLDYTPDHYPLGYMLVSYGREKYGDQFWKDVTHDAAAFNSLFYPFQNAFKARSGVGFSTFSKETFTQFKKTFHDQPETSPAKHFVADREYPTYMDDQTMVYMKSTYDHRPVFVINQGTTEREIRVRDISLDTYFSYHNGKIVYAAYRPDPRWGYRTYNELRVLDVNTGEEEQLTHHTKYFSPSFSPDGKRIVAIDVEPSGKSTLHILNAANGKVLSIVPNTQNWFYTYPRFFNDHQLVVNARSKDGRSGIAKIDIATGKGDMLLTPGLSPSGYTAIRSDTVYFTATDHLRDHLFAVANNQVFRLNNDQLDHTIGNYEPAMSDTKLAWVSFTAEGYQIHQTDKNTVKWEPVTGNALPPPADMGITALAKTDPAADVLAKVNNEALPVTKYSKAYHLFNFHSLIPSFDDPNYSISLEGQNVLNTFRSSLLFNYNRDEGYKEFGFGAVYGGLYPYLSGGADYTADRKGYYNGGDVYWNEMQLHVGASVPLVFTNGTQITSLSFGTDVVYNSTSFQSAYRSLFNDRSYTYLNNSISISHRISQAKQNIYPRFAQSLSLNYKTAVNGADANQFLATGNLYLPGLSVNHNLVINAAFQQKNRNSVISFSNNFPFSRGYTAENLDQMEKVGVNYHFPIAYPDAGIANTVYFLRIRGNLFYDFTHTNFDIRTTNYKFNFRTVGAEMYFDTQWFNQVPITFGLRYSHLLDDDVFGGYGRNRIELIVPLTLF